MGPAELQPVPPTALGLLVHSSSARLTSTHTLQGLSARTQYKLKTQTLVSLSLNILRHLKA